MPLGIQGLAVRFAHEGVFAWARAAETAWAHTAWAPVAAAWADAARAHAAWADAAWGADAARAPVRLAPAGGGSKPQALPCALTVCCVF